MCLVLVENHLQPVDVAQHDLELEVVAVRVAVEQVQNARVHLIQEEHEKHLQHLKKEHKDQLNALHAELDNLHAGQC